MPPKNKKRSETPMTTSLALGSLIKAARDIMRKDKGLNGDVDRLPLLTWIMFLKFLDDLELQREQEAILARKKFHPAIEPPYRWRDWAANPQGITGDALLSFINQDEARRPDGKKGLGLFAYLRGLSSSNRDNRRDVISIVFRGVDNRMKSGYLLRDVINKISNLQFTSSDELHTLGTLYESMLSDMRDAAGDSGEFYTPRPVVKFMVEAIDPKLGETVLDPASGTGGFLVEAFNHLSQQVKTVADRKRLQKESIFGCEPKSLPYLLAQMNLLLHGLDAPQIDPGNALRFKLSQIGERDRVNVILTNPPFGGEEEKGIQDNFPDDCRTSETALLFLQLIIRRVKRTGHGRVAVVVPESVMADPGVAQRIRRHLVEQMNLHTIVRLPKGVFEPYSDIQTNLLFFDTSGTTERVWYYQHEVPESRKKTRDPKYTITSPVTSDDLQPVADWFKKKSRTPRAWPVSRKQIEKNNFSLDFRNPARIDRGEISIPELSAAALSALRQATNRLNYLVTHTPQMEVLRKNKWPEVTLADLLKRRKIEANVDDQKVYQQITVRLYGKGVIQRGKLRGSDIKTRPQFLAHSGDLIMSRIDARNGAFGIIPSELEGALVTQDFPMFHIDPKVVVPAYLALLLKSEEFTEICKRASRGTTNRKRLKEALLLQEKIPLPPKPIQEKFLRIASEASQAIVSATMVAEAAAGVEREVCNLMLLP